jgi:hypothetical protein
MQAVVRPSRDSDRQALERIFGIRERRARQLMASLPTVKVGNALAVSRPDLINSFQKDSMEPSSLD